MSEMVIDFPVNPIFATVKKYQAQQQDMEDTLLPAVVNYLLHCNPMFKTQKEFEEHSAIMDRITGHMDGLAALEEEFRVEIAFLKKGTDDSQG